MADDAKYILQFWNVNTPSWNIASTAMTFEPVPVACIEADDRMDITNAQEKNWTPEYMMERLQ